MLVTNISLIVEWFRVQCRSLASEYYFCTTILVLIYCKILQNVFDQAPVPFIFPGITIKFTLSSSSVSYQFLFLCYAVSPLTPSSNWNYSFEVLRLLSNTIPIGLNGRTVFSLYSLKFYL